MKKILAVSVIAVMSVLICFSVLPAMAFNEKLEVVESTKLSGKMADVPHRDQIGGTCGLYALGMVMDYWYEKDVKNTDALVSSSDLNGYGVNYNFKPNTNEYILDYVKEMGYSADGEMYVAKYLAKTAAHYGYKVSLYDNASLNDIYKVVRRGHPAIVAFDVDDDGNPGTFEGLNAHYGIIEGYFAKGNEMYLYATHGWEGADEMIWKSKDFYKSWYDLKKTDCYGYYGDGIIPDSPGLKEPYNVKLRNLGGNYASIYDELAGKIIEVVPQYEQNAGGKLINP